MPKKLYSQKLRLEIVKRYFNANESIKTLSETYKVSKTEIQKWIARYRENGEEELSTVHGTYTGDFKLHVVEYIEKTGASNRYAAAKFNIPSPTTVRNWVLLYRNCGKKVLYEERRGIKTGMYKKKVKNTKEHDKSSVNTQKLLEEIAKLRMENEYLKKLNALIQEQESSKILTK